MDALQDIKTAEQLGAQEVANADLRRHFRVLLSLLAAVKSGDVDVKNVTVDLPALTFRLDPPKAATPPGDGEPQLKLVTDQPTTAAGEQPPAAQTA